MWLVDHVTAGVPYNLVFLCFVDKGRLEPATLAAAVRETVARHEGLRTVFLERDGEVVREVMAGYVPELASAGYDGPAGGFDEHVRRVAAEFGRRPFDVSAAPALRLLLLSVRRAARRWCWRRTT